MSCVAAKAETRSPTAWADEVDEAEAGRTPGRGVHMHEKLSSPSRKRYSSLIDNFTSLS